MSSRSKVEDKSTSAGVAADGAKGADVRWWVLTAVGIGTFMSALDGSVVNTIQPLLKQALHSDVATVEWVLTVYLLVVSGLLLGVGRWGDMHGHKSVYLTGFAVFIGASAMCGLSATAGWLITARVIQAIGAAMLYSAGPAIITQNFPPEMRGRALGIQLTMTYLGLMTGPLFGGWLAQHFGWESVFFINIPVGIPAVYLTLRYIPRDRGADTGKKFDLLGAGLFLVGLVALLYALNQGHAWGWTDVKTLGLSAIAIAVLVAFFLAEARVKDPMLDLSLLRNRLFAMASVSALLNYIGLYSALFLVPYYLGDGRGMEPARIGAILCVQPLAMAAIAAFSGAISDRIGTRWPATIGLGIQALGLFVLSCLTETSSLSLAALGLALAGFGIGMFVSPNNSAMMGAAPKERRGIASGVMATSRNVGMVLGIGMAGAIYTSILGSAEHGSHPPIGMVVSGVHYGLLAACGTAILGAISAYARE